MSAACGDDHVERPNGDTEIGPADLLALTDAQGLDAQEGPGSVASAFLPAQRRQSGEGLDGAYGATRGDDPIVPARGDERLRLLLVGSSGGHLAQLTALEPWSRAHDRHWVCFDTPDAVSILAAEQVTWAHHPTTRNVPNLVRNLVLAWKVLRRERPDVVISTGAGVAVPFFVLGRLTGVPTLFLEVYDRLDTPTLTGRLCRPFATRMLVQWEEQRSLYRDAEVVGCVL